MPTESDISDFLLLPLSQWGKRSSEERQSHWWTDWHFLMWYLSPAAHTWAFRGIYNSLHIDRPSRLLQVKRERFTTGQMGKHVRHEQHSRTRKKENDFQWRYLVCLLSYLVHSTFRPIFPLTASWIGTLNLPGLIRLKTQDANKLWISAHTLYAFPLTHGKHFYVSTEINIASKGQSNPIL